MMPESTNKWFKKQLDFFCQENKLNKPIERPMVEKGLWVNERGVQFAAEGSHIETKNHQLRETSDHTRLEAWRPGEFKKRDNIIHSKKNI